MSDKQQVIDSYLTLQSKTSAEIKVERSRFIGEAFPADSRAQAEELYQQTRKQRHDATHHCYAYQVGTPLPTESRFSDDGEPNGTGGRPILEVLQKEGLTNALIVVTRYYGGVKLGTGGLSRAYREAAKAALSAGQIAERVVRRKARINAPHDLISTLLRALADQQIKPLGTEFGEGVQIECEVRLREVERFEATIRELSRGQAQIEWPT